MAERSNSTCEKCFSCEVYVTVDPTADVKKVQTDISDLLSSIFSFNFLTIEVVYDSIMVLPAVILPHVTGPPPTLSASLTTSEKGLTRSPQPQPVNKSTTGGPLDRTVGLGQPAMYIKSRYATKYYMLMKEHDMAERSNSTCEKCFSCEVYVTVDPTADVKKVQTDISDLLSSIFSFNFLTIEVVYDSIMVLPAVILPHVTGPPPTLSASLTTSEKGLTRSPQPQPVNKSTTGGPLDRTVGLVMPDQFFRVNLTLCIRGSLLRPKDFIENWLKHQLETNGTMTVVNLFIKDSSSRSMKEYTNLMTSYTEEEQYNCAFHVREFRKSNVADVESLIYFALISKYGNASFEIQTKNVSIKHIEPKNCLKQDISSIYGQYNWPETFPQDIAEMGCIKPVSNRAYRLCKLDIKSDTTNWAYPDMKNCDKVVTISEISNITVTPGNAAEVVDIIQDAVDAQLSNKPGLSFSELGSVMEKLSEVVDVSIIETIVGNRIVHIVANILLSETDITPVADILLDLTDQMGNCMEFSGEYANIKAHALAFSMINVDPEEFNGLTFSVSLSSTMNPEVFVNQSFVNQSHAEANATISLPTELINFFPHGVRNTTRVQFHFYGTLDLFQDPYLNNETTRNMTLNSFVVSASVNNSQVINLKERVVVTLKHKTPKMTEDEVQCMFWDFQKYDGHGGWNNSGCETLSESAYWTSCLCDHLTHFAVLLDVTRSPLSDTYTEVLTVISYLGCGISGFFLGITLLTYLILEKLRQDYPSKILINLSTALLGLSIFFLVDPWLSSFSNYGLCIAAAAFLHYFLLASCTWMGLEAVHMYIALVKVFNIYMPFYLLRLCVIGWGVPLLIVSLVLAIDKDAYGSSTPELVGVALQSSEKFCWLQKKVFYNVTVVGFILLIFLGNITVFIMVVIQIKKMRANNPSANSRTAVQDFRVLVGLTVLLGLTWSVGFLSFGPGRGVVLCLFAILNSFQGFFVFLFHCLMKENVRKQWRIYLCCGRFRVIESLEWTHSVTVGRRNKKRNLVNSDSLPSDNSSSIRSNNST
ncbi:PREDICTED: adhesion G-protein coupled receptor G4 [Cyprinodon variegatus]|uniref:adhesion G-protein coupled receptor G4 n=1 Tax=Cyprinodon variegatus TaxID=28743 RepID=UPI000742BDFD|nr:PREDICTED: adhesion G-protein coupled receptor G4 [Cyprinodon variegatus]